MGMTAAWTSLGVCQMRRQAQKALATLPGTQRLLHTATLVIRLASPKSTAYGSDSAVSWNNTLSGNSAVVQTLGLGTLTARTPVWSLVGEIRSHKLCSTAKKITKGNFKNNPLSIINKHELIRR